MHDDMRNKPDKAFRCGAVQGAIWANRRVIDNAVVEVYSIRIDKAYKAGDEWKRTTSFAPEDLPKVSVVAMACYEHLRLRSFENGPSDPEDLFETELLRPDEERNQHEEI
jgi:hypothetical protein